MDIGTGKTYASLDEALAAGVAPSDLVRVEKNEETLLVQGVGPFKGRTYRRDPLTGNLVRVKLAGAKR